MIPTNNASTDGVNLEPKFSSSYSSKKTNMGRRKVNPLHKRLIKSTVNKVLISRRK